MVYTSGCGWKWGWGWEHFVRKWLIMHSTKTQTGYQKYPQKFSPKLVEKKTKKKTRTQEVVGS